MLVSFTSSKSGRRLPKLTGPSIDERCINLSGIDGGSDEIDIGRLSRREGNRPRLL
jgi:hypothetical protein